MPTLYIFAGPNGAGKTTLATKYLSNQDFEFVNADQIAESISPGEPEVAAMEAGRQMLNRIQGLVQQKIDFAIETTLSGKWLRSVMPNCRYQGYQVELIYIQLDNPNLAVSRVKDRVLRGGHNILEDVIRRRFERSRRLFESPYKFMPDRWILLNNSGESPIFVDEVSSQTNDTPSAHARELLDAFKTAVSEISKLP